LLSAMACRSWLLLEYSMTARARGSTCASSTSLQAGPRLSNTALTARTSTLMAIWSLLQPTQPLACGCVSLSNFWVSRSSC
ncbi:hypothetical protein GGH95_002823, partial [Coemansia sp. RSA 1836]